MVQFRDNGFVEVPRRWNPKSMAALCVASALKWPQTLRTEAEFIAAHPQTDGDSVLRPAMTAAIVAHVEKGVQSAWSHARLSR